MWYRVADVLTQPSFKDDAGVVLAIAGAGPYTVTYGGTALGGAAPTFATQALAGAALLKVVHASRERAIDIAAL